MERLKFVVDKKQFFGILSQLSKVLKRSNGNLQHQEGEFTVTKDKLIINAPGVTFNIKVFSDGGAKFSTNIVPFAGAIKLFKENLLEFTLYNNQISCGTFRLNVESLFINNDRVLRHIDLPLNYNKVDLLRLTNGRYTDEEIAFNKMRDLVVVTEEELRDNILKIANILQTYDIRYETIDSFVRKELKLESQTKQ